MRRAALVAPLLALACSVHEPTTLPEPSARLAWARHGDAAFEIRLDGQPLGELRAESDGFSLRGAGPAVTIVRDESALTAAHAYPRRVRIEGSVAAGGAGFRHEYTLLAPAAPLPVEGYGLVVETDAAGINDAEHEALRAWLGEQGLPADTGPFQALHVRETGRALRVWHEISGRRIDGSFTRIGDPAPLARIDSLFRSDAGGLKIHRKRPGENGRFTYHRQSLELADRIEARGLPEIVAHECGCYGYAIAADFTTVGGALYQVEADWLDDRVGAEFFVGFEARDHFPWLGLGERRRMRDLARRARAFILRDAAGERFAEVALELPPDPPPGGLGTIRYRVDGYDARGTARAIARIEVTPDHVAIDLYESAPSGEGALEQLDQLLAAMPAQVTRGDGLRDSQLGEVERLVDAVRWLRAPSESHLADFVSDVDAANAGRKVEALLAGEAARFRVATSALPPAPIRGPGIATAQR